MRSGQWTIIICFAIFCWGAKGCFNAYLEKRYELETLRQHEETLRVQIRALEKVAGLSVNTEGTP